MAESFRIGWIHENSVYFYEPPQIFLAREKSSFTSSLNEWDEKNFQFFSSHSFNDDVVKTKKAQITAPNRMLNTYLNFAETGEKKQRLASEVVARAVLPCSPDSLESEQGKDHKPYDH